MAKKLKREQEIADTNIDTSQSEAEILAERALNSHQDGNTTAPSVANPKTATEIAKETAIIEAEKAERKRQREHRRRLRQAEAELTRKSQLVIPIIFFLTLLACLILSLIFNNR